jgi:hypothetical protein
MITKRLLTQTLSLVAVGAGILVASPAKLDAAVWSTCNGSPVKWRKTLNVNRNRCSIPDSGAVKDAYLNGSGQWQQYKPVISGLFVNPATDCTINTGDGQNEVGLATRASIDGNNGLTFRQDGTCFIGSNDIDEADILVANDMPFGDPAANSMTNVNPNPGRVTFVHEFGHLIAFEHENAFSIMKTQNPRPLVGGTSNHASVFPSDTIGLNALYGFNSQSNLVSSAHTFGTNVQLGNPTETRFVCRGQSVTVNFTIGQNGNVAAPLFRARVRLSQTAVPAGFSFADGTEVSAADFNFGGFSQFSPSFTFTVPSFLPNGVHFVYFDVDTFSESAESKEDDNSTISGLALNIGC